MPVPVSKNEIDQAVAGWDALRPEGENPGYLVGGDERRTALIQGLREFADLMESRPDLPVPRSISPAVFLHGTAQERNAQLQYACELLGQTAGPPYEGSDTLQVAQEFGPVRYQLMVFPTPEQDAAPLFSVGQEVRLSAGAAHVAETVRLAQAGTVAGIETSPYGTHAYTVHFPGRTGTQRGWTESALDKAPPFRPVTLASGEAVSSLEAAEALLIERGTQIKLQALSARKPGQDLLADHYALTSAVAEACGLTGSELLRQIEPQAEERVRGQVSTHGLPAPKTAPELAASDRQRVTATVEAVPVQRDDQPAPAKPVSAPARGKRR